jgi:hypothetical protein
VLHGAPRPIDDRGTIGAAKRTPARKRDQEHGEPGNRNRPDQWSVRRRLDQRTREEEQADLWWAGPGGSEQPVVVTANDRHVVIADERRHGVSTGPIDEERPAREAQKAQVRRAWPTLGSTAGLAAAALDGSEDSV